VEGDENGDERVDREDVDTRGDRRRGEEGRGKRSDWSEIGRMGTKIVV